MSPSVMKPTANEQVTFYNCFGFASKVETLHLDA